MNFYELCSKAHEFLFYKPVKKLEDIIFHVQIKLNSNAHKHRKLSLEDIHKEITYANEYRLKYIRDLIAKGETLIGIEVQDLKELEQLEKEGKLKTWEEVEKIRIEKFHSKKS